MCSSDLGAFGVVNRIRITSAGLTALLQLILIYFWPSGMMLMLGFVLGTSMGSWAAWIGLKQFLLAHDLPETQYARHKPCHDWRELMRTHGKTPMIALPAALINTFSPRARGCSQPPDQCKKFPHRFPRVRGDVPLQQPTEKPHVTVFIEDRKSVV